MGFIGAGWLVHVDMTNLRFQRHHAAVEIRRIISNTEASNCYFYEKMFMKFEVPVVKILFILLVKI